MLVRKEGQRSLVAMVMVAASFPQLELLTDNWAGLGKL